MSVLYRYLSCVSNHQQLLGILTMIKIRSPKEKKRVFFKILVVSLAWVICLPPTLPVTL